MPSRNRAGPSCGKHAAWPPACPGCHKKVPQKTRVILCLEQKLEEMKIETEDVCGMTTMMGDDESRSGCLEAGGSVDAPTGRRDQLKY